MGVFCIDVIQSINIDAGNINLHTLIWFKHSGSLQITSVYLQLMLPCSWYQWYTVHTWWHHTLETETSCVCVLIRHFLCAGIDFTPNPTADEIGQDSLLSTDAVFFVWYRLIKGWIFTCNFMLSAALTPAAHMERPYWKLHMLCCREPRALSVEHETRDEPKDESGSSVFSSLVSG